MTNVAHILSAIERGDPKAADELLPLAYDELRKRAAVRLASEKPGQTLQATARTSAAAPSRATRPATAAAASTMLARPISREAPCPAIPPGPEAAASSTPL